MSSVPSSTSAPSFRACGEDVAEVIPLAVAHAPAQRLLVEARTRKSAILFILRHGSVSLLDAKATRLTARTPF